MDNSIIAALSAILGSTVGGLTSFATTLFNQRYVTRRAMLLKDVANREQPYSEFLKEVASLYKDSLNSHTQRDSPAGFDHRYVLALSRIRMISSEAVLNAAEKVVEDVLEAYRRPPITFREFQQFWGPTRSVARVYQSMSSRASKHAGTLVVTLVWRELRIPNPLINFRTLSDQNFRWSCIIIFCAFGVLYANTTTLPALLQSLFGYDATTSGMVLSPAGLFAVMGLIFAGVLMSRGVDARYFMVAGLITMGIGNYWTSQLTLEISPWQVVWPRVAVIAGLSMIFAPLNVAAFLYIPKEMRAGAVGLLALLRNEGGSVGTSIAQTIHERREQFHTLRLGENLDLLNPAVTSFLEQAQAYLLQFTGDGAAAKQMALQLLDNLRQQQASAFAYFDIFFVFAVLSAPLVALVFMMKRSVAEKGAHVAAE